MSDIDVEAVDSTEIEDSPDEGVSTAADADLPADVDAPEYVLYGGKGGVGKTTCAAATALASAAAGTRTLVVSTDPAHSLSDTLGVDVPARPERIHEDVPLWGVEIDPDAAMEEGLFAARQGEGPLGGLGGLLGGDGGFGRGAGTAEGDDTDTVGGNGTGPTGGNGAGTTGGNGAVGMEDLLGGTMPGADEAAAMQKLLEHLDDPRFDRVVVDTAPTGHTLRLLQLPEMLDTMVGRMLKLRDQFSGMMDGLRGLFGAGGESGSEDAPDLDELKARIERLRSVLRDPDRTDFRVVMVPEEMSVVETERLVARLGEFEIPVSTLVVNRVMEDPTEVAGEALAATGETGDGDEASTPIVTPDLADCEFCRRRWEVQQNALNRATDLFRGRDVRRVPLLAEEVRGERGLRVVAACLD